MNEGNVQMKTDKAGGKGAARKVHRAPLPAFQALADAPLPLGGADAARLYLPGGDATGRSSG